MKAAVIESKVKISMDDIIITQAKKK